MSNLKSSSDIVSSAEKRRMKRKKRIQRRKTIVTIILILGVAIGILFTPLFNLSDIVIEGNQKITREEIIKKGELTVGKNIFMFNLNKIGGKLSKIPYMNSLLVKRRLPNKIIIRMSESIPMAYVISKKGYVVIDKNGKALEECADTSAYKIPLLKNITAEKVALADKIIINNEENFQKTLEILRDLYNNSFISEIMTIELNEENVILSISENLIIKMGGLERISAKIVMVKEVVSSLPEDAVGTIDASNPDKVYYDKTPPFAENDEEEQEEQAEDAPEQNADASAG